jgi:hypothetical protein
VRVGKHLEVVALAINPWSTTFPINWAYLPLEPGLTVLFGLNGAGKSLLLEGLRECLTGLKASRLENANPTLIVRLLNDAFRDDGWELEVAEQAIELFSHFRTPVDYWAIEGGETHTPGAQDLPDRVKARMLQSLDGWPAAEGSPPLAELVEEMWAQQRFAVTARGVETSEWYVSPVGVPGTDTPALSAAAASWAERRAEGVGRLNPVVLFWSHSTSLERRWDVQPPLYVLDGDEWPTDRLHFPILDPLEMDSDAATREIFETVALRLLNGTSGIPDDESPAPNTGRDSPNSALTRLTFTKRALVDASEEKIAWLVTYTDRFDRATWLSVTASGALRADSGAATLATDIEARANSFYARLLVDAPVLSLDMGSPQTWLSSSGTTWGARRHPDAPWIPLNRVSDAERRWANVAVALALSIQPRGVLLLDEPEKALHRSAERFMAQGLREIAAEFELTVVAATHSPELLNAPDANVAIVRRTDQRQEPVSQVANLSALGREELLSFGLRPSDLLDRKNGFLLVEGQHDLLIVRHLLGDELERLRVEVVPMRGAGRLKTTFDSRILYDFTDAHIFVLLDALDSALVKRTWDEATNLAKTRSSEDAINRIRLNMSAVRTDEAGFLEGFMTRAIELGMSQRHTPLSLQLPDILDYLPVSAFVKPARSWEALRNELASALDRRPSGTEFKKWLRHEKGADLTDRNIEKVAAGLDHIPTEFTVILHQIERTVSAPKHQL